MLGIAKAAHKNGTMLREEARCGSAIFRPRCLTAWCGRSAGPGRAADTWSGRNRNRRMKSPVIKRSIVIAGHKTSVSVEDAFWTALKEIAQLRRQSLAELIGAIDGARRGGNLSSAIRVFVLDYYRGR